MSNAEEETHYSVSFPSFAFLAFSETHLALVYVYERRGILTAFYPADS